jgi:hypothetical protein
MTILHFAFRRNNNQLSRRLVTTRVHDRNIAALGRHAGTSQSICKILLLLFNGTANGFLAGGSGTTIRLNT